MVLFYYCIKSVYYLYLLICSSNNLNSIIVYLICICKLDKICIEYKIQHIKEDLLGLINNALANLKLTSEFISKWFMNAYAVTVFSFN